MKVYLFLYPIREYVETSLEGRYLKERGRDPRRLNKIIDYRYRRGGFQVTWLFFSAHTGSKTPDLTRTSELIEVAPSDLVIGYGVSFAEHCEFRLYPRLKFVFDQLPTPIDELVLGGFHQQDCVDKVARYAHWRRKIQAWVDEDTTDFFFATTSINGPIPLNRRGPDIYSELIKHGEEWVQAVREVRKDKPWLDQVLGPK
ncbi:MAG: hypothetical protein WD187_00970 [Candidatus Woykebacteria bacterium]